jgi:hypothetical protein
LWPNNGINNLAIDIRNGGLGWDLISHIFVCLDWFWWQAKGLGLHWKMKAFIN